MTSSAILIADTAIFVCFSCVINSSRTQLESLESFKSALIFCPFKSLEKIGSILLTKRLVLKLYVNQYHVYFERKMPYLWSTQNAQGYLIVSYCVTGGGGGRGEE